MTTPAPPLARHAAEPPGDPLGPAGDRRLLLVCPPFQNPQVASLATAHLATVVRERGGRCEEAYPHFELARHLGLETYLEVGGGTSLAGELLFAEGLHGPSDEPAVAAILAAAFGDGAAREQIRQAFAERVFATTDYAAFDLVGFTTSFNQLLAALFIARALKRRHPRVEVALGGAACAAPMGASVLAGYPEVDFVVSGWGEAPLLALSRGEHEPRRLLESPAPLELDALPVPDYAALLAAASTAWRDRPLALAFESSRGCWWGQKHQCRFCGVNGPSLGYHLKSSARVVREVRAQWERHGRNLVATDAILAREHLDEVIPELMRFAEGPRIFYELRTNVTADQVAALAQARVQAQPGIESLSTRLLELLGKGLSAIQNLAFLKWAAERRLPVAWNLLYAIPGELVVDYERQIALMEHIPHLAPAGRINPIHLARHSPFFEEREAYGYRDVEPLVEYRGMHPHLDAAARFTIAKYFQGQAPVDPAAYRDRLEQALSRWTRRHAQGDGLFLHPERGLVRNQGDEGRHFPSSPVFDAVLDLTHEIVGMQDLLAATRAPRALITAMQEAGILFIERDRVLNLAVRLGLGERSS